MSVWRLPTIVAMTQTAQTPTGHSHAAVDDGMKGTGLLVWRQEIARGGLTIAQLCQPATARRRVTHARATWAMIHSEIILSTQVLAWTLMNAQGRTIATETPVVRTRMAPSRASATSGRSLATASIAV